MKKKRSSWALEQRIRSFLLDGVLRRHDEERLLQRLDRAADGGPAVLLHRFEEGRLRLRRRTVDLVGEDDLGEERSLLEGEDAALALRASR